MVYISIFEDGYITGEDYSKRENCLGNFEISKEEHKQLISGTHIFDIEKKKIIVNKNFQQITKSQEEIEQAQLQRIKELLIEKQALEILGKDTTAVDEEILKIQQESLES